MYLRTRFISIRYFLCICGVLLCMLCLFSACDAISNLLPSASPLPDTVELPSVTIAPASTPQPTEEPTPAPSPTPEPTPSGLCGGLYDVFTNGEIIQTEDSYQSDEIALFYSVEQTDSSGKYGKEYIHILEFYIQDIAFLRSFIWDHKGSGEAQGIPLRLSELANKSNALAAISGDFFHNRTKGLSVRNGEVLRDTIDSEYDICIIYRDGSAATMGLGEYDETVLQDPNIWQILSFGPYLFDADGNPMEKYPVAQVASGKKAVHDTGHYNKRNQRLAFGVLAPGHYVWVLVEGGNSRSSGMRLSELAEWMQDFGCSFAYNLDGGQTSQMWVLGKLRNETGYNGIARYLRDILLIPNPQTTGDAE